MGGGVRGAMFAVLVMAAACGPARPVVPAATMVATAPPPSASASDDDFEREWHTFRPSAMPWSGHNGSTPLYPVAIGYGCQHIGRFADDVVFNCGRSLVRLGKEGSSVEPFRAAKLHESHPVERPDAVFEREGETWMRTTRLLERYPDPNRATDPFFVYQGSVSRLHGGQWTSFQTAETPERHGKGWLVFDLPRFENEIDRKAPGCADFACAKVLPFFFAADTTAPDFKAFDGKLAWIHPYENEQDYAYVVEKDGPVYVFLRVLDLVTQKRVVGVLSWTAEAGARFEPVPSFAGDAHFNVMSDRPKAKANAKSVPFQFVVTPSKPGGAEAAQLTVQRDGKRWVVAKVPPPKPGDPFEGYEVPSDGPDIGGYRMARSGFLERNGKDGDWEMFEVQQAQLMPGKHGDLVMGAHFAAVYHSVRPRESLLLTDSWGDLHPWPEPASDDCAHPFAVFDALDPHTHDMLLAEGRKNGRGALGPWGVLPEGWMHLQLVEFRLFDPPLVVIGAPLASMNEAKLLREQWEKRSIGEWGLAGLGGERNATGVFCARPVKPKPFALPF